MTIHSGDIKLMASERLTDNPNGGGRITGNEIVDGASNNLFEDISDLDRTYGDVSLRKAYVAVRTDSTDQYYGAHVIVDEVPEDDNVDVSMFTTESWDDERRAARDRIESYVIQGPLSQMRLMGDQLPGQRQILAYTMPDTELPVVGSVLCLSTEEGPSQGERQFVRVTDLSSQIQTFVDNQGDYKRLVVTLEIGSALEYRFYGQSPARATGVQPDTIIRRTTVAAVSRYYATKPLTQPASLQDTTVRASSIFTPIVPSARTETPIIDERALGDRVRVVPAGDAITRTYNTAFDDVLYLGRPITPGTLTLNDNGYVDDGSGDLRTNNGLLVATVDHEAGTITAVAPSQLSSNPSITWTPGAAVTGVSWTKATNVTLASRGYNYTFQLRPMPWKGTVMVDYMAQGRWYRVKDRGDGELVGDVPGSGTGTVNFQTGTVLFTASALPDVETKVIVYWGTRATHTHITNTTPAAVGVIEKINGEIDVGTLSVNWTVSGTSYSATAEAKLHTYLTSTPWWGYSQFTGDAEGSIVAGDNGAATQLRLVLDALPAAGSSLAVDYKKPQSVTAHSTTVSPSNGAITTTLTNAPVAPTTLEISVPANGVEKPVEMNPRLDYMPKTVKQTLHITDDGKGNLVGDVAPGGTIDYATGAVTGQPIKVVETKIYGIYKDYPLFAEYEDATVVLEPTGSPAQLSYNTEVAGGLSESASVTIDELKMQINPTGTEDLVPGSVMFDLNGWTYVDRAGTLYGDFDPATGAGVVAGSIDYTSGIATITNWQGGPNEFTLRAAALAYQQPSLKSAIFRTSGAPLRPGSTQIRATEVDGDSVIDSADQNGGFSGPGIASGDVNSDVGIVQIEFTHPVAPASIKYNTVVVGYLPLDPDILGLDPVRLPISGRVPAFKVGDVVVVHNTQRKPVNTLAAGDTLDTGRTRLARIEIIDANGTTVDPALYTADLDAGTLTLDTPLDLSPYTAPYELVHRIEDMGLATDVRVNGYVELNIALSHDYPANTTYLSSAIIAGDMAARYLNLFEQQTWQGEFKDDPVGGAPTGQYDDVNYPIQVTNRGALQERWAIVFTGTTSFNVVGEHVGQIAIGDTTTDMAPTNPMTNVPYFTLDALGWSSGWSAGNVLRFDTQGATYPLWVARTILQGPAEGLRDDFTLQIRGNANRP